MNKVKSFLVAASLALCIIPAHAQRTANRQFFLTPEVSLPNLGGSVAFGQYQLMGYWFAQLGYNGYGDRTYAPAVDVISRILEADPQASVGGYPRDISSSRFYVQGGYMFRLLATRDRVLNVYLGLGAQAGYEMTGSYYALKGDQYGSGVPDVEFRPDRYFCFAGEPRLAVEVFPMRKVAFVLECGIPLSINSGFGVFSWEAMGGLRFLF